MRILYKRIRETAAILSSETAACSYIILVMLSLPIFEFLDELHGNRFVSQPVIMEIAGIAGALIAILHFAFQIRRKRLYPSDILYVLLILFAVLSMIFSQNKDRIYARYGYDEWPLHFLAYFSLMVAGTIVQSSRLKKTIIKALFLVVILQSVVALFQTYGIVLMKAYFDPEKIASYKRTYGLTQHSNWYGGLSVLFFACTSGAYLFTKDRATRCILYAVSMLSLYTLIASDARLAWAGTIAYLLFFAASLVIMKRAGYDAGRLKTLRTRFLLLCAGVIAVSAYSILAHGRIIDKWNKTRNELNKKWDRLGSSRGYIWRFGLESVPYYWPFGLGLDNYIDAFFKNRNYVPGAFTQDKGHNEYIHYLVTQGLFQLITYLSLLVYAVKTGVRTVLHTADEENRELSWIFLGMFAGYAAQAMFNSSIINVAPYFWITIGLCLSKRNQLSLKEEWKVNRKGKLITLGACAVCLVGLIIFFRAASTGDVPNGVYTISSAADSDLRITTAKSQDGNLVLAQADDVPSQEFTIRYIGGDCYQITSKASPRLSLDVRGGSADNNVPVIKYKATVYAKNQQWLLQEEGDGTYHIVTMQNKAFSIGIKGQDIAAGSQVVMKKTNDVETQKWILEKVE